MININKIFKNQSPENESAQNNLYVHGLLTIETF